MATTIGLYTHPSQITGPTGWYNIRYEDTDIPVYINQDYDGGGWVLVLANRAFTSGMNNLSYYDAINKCNYRTGNNNNSTNTVVEFYKDFPDLTNFNVWIGLKYWSILSGGVYDDKITVVQFVSTTHGTELNDTSNHTKRYRWRFDGFNATYGMTGATALSDETGTGAPGFYSYHAANGFSLTTYDNDQDLNGGNCSTYYNNNPWWYGSCWSGNYFAGGGYTDQANWNSAGSDLHVYGAVYIK